MKRPGVFEPTALELMDVEILQGEMRFFRKQKPADPYAAFSERYGVRLPKAETEEAPPEPEDEPPKDEPEAAGPLWAHSALGVGLGASQKEINAAYRGLARVHDPDVEGDGERMKWITEQAQHYTCPLPDCVGGRFSQDCVNLK